MIPIRDSTRSERFPITNTVIIGINVLVFLWELGLGDRLGEVFLLHGIVPARYTLPSLASRFSLTAQILPFITSMFLHGGLLHVAGNMWFLHIFGDNVEDRLGPVRYFFFYMGCGILAGLTHVLLNWNSRLPTVGASGAIAGVMGAYFVLYPRAKVLT
jgi:membrane associated rhomboid family serine protease